MDVLGTCLETDTMINVDTQWTFCLLHQN